MTYQLILSLIGLPVLVVALCGLLLTTSNSKDKQPLENMKANLLTELNKTTGDRYMKRSANRKLRRAVKKRFNIDIPLRVTYAAHEQLRSMVNYNA